MMAAAEELDKAGEEKKRLAEDWQAIEQEIETNIRVIKSFTGARRIEMLERFPGWFQQAVGVLSKSIWGKSFLKDKLEQCIAGQDIKTKQQYWIVVNKERQRELEDMAGDKIMEEEIKVLQSINGGELFKVVYDISEVPDEAYSLENPQVIYLSDIEDKWEDVDNKLAGKIGIEKMEQMLYLPALYNSSILYLAARLLLASGDINTIDDKLTRNVIRGFYSALLGREVSDIDLRRLFRSPWEILPQMVRLTDKLDTLREAVVKIERAA